MLLSFNGRSFDWPLLRSRYVMNRLPPPPERPHVDLLHCARRVFRHHLDQLKLSTLEQRVLDVHRRGDIDGALIPAAWFDFLRTGRVAVLARVLSHNERDVRSMVDLVTAWWPLGKSGTQYYRRRRWGSRRWQRGTATTRGRCGS